MNTYRQGQILGLALVANILTAYIGPAKDTKNIDNIANPNAVVHIEDAGCRDYKRMAPELNFSPAYTLPDCEDKYLQ